MFTISKLVGKSFPHPVTVFSKHLEGPTGHILQQMCFCISKMSGEMHKQNRPSNGNIYIYIYIYYILQVFWS